MNLLTTRGFLLGGGVVLVALGVLGMFVLGPTPDQSLLHMFNWLDSTENLAHLLLGVVALAAYYLLRDKDMTRWLVILVGVVALVAAVAGFLNSGNPDPNTAGLTNLEMSDNLLHLVVAAWAFYAAFMGDKSRA